MNSLNKLSIRDLTKKVVQQLRQVGLSESTVMFYQNESFMLIMRFFEEREILYYSPDIMREYLAYEQSRFEKGEIGEKRLRALELGAKRLMRIANGEELNWRVKKRRPQIAVPQEYQNLLDLYISSLHQAESTVHGKAAIVRRYLSYLKQRGLKEPGSWRAQDLKQFIWDVMGVYNSRNHLLSVLRDFHAYLSELGIITFAYEDVLLHPATPYKKVFPCFTESEISQILTSIDTSEAIGKRDYAILLLAVKTGLRTIDISRLRLSDVNWTQSEINVIQQKTMQPLSLPIDEVVMAAITDYILNGRQHTSSEYIFLRGHAPFQEFHDGHAIAHMFRRRLKAAGLEKKNGDGRGVHALRRTLGTAMAKADIPVATISQVLGHQSLNSVKRYLSLDDTHLKRCALTLSGIEVSRRELIENV